MAGLVAPFATPADAPAAQHLGFREASRYNQAIDFALPCPASRADRVPTKNLICIVVEGLHAGMIGAYGNSWIRTSALDELASQSAVFDQAFVTRPTAEQFYRDTWGESLPRQWREAGLQTVLVTDSAELASMSAAADFAVREVLEPAGEANTASDLAETHLAKIFSTAAQSLEKLEQPFVLWIHTRGMAGPWDAPLELRNRFAEEDDPEPPKIVVPPTYWLPDDFDADEPLGIKHAYAGQITLLDECLGAFLEAVNESSLAGTALLTLLSTGGYPLGEHRRIGACDQALYNETTQLAWMMRFPGTRAVMNRHQALVQPTDLPGTLMDWLGLIRPDGATSLMPLVQGDVDSLRDALLIVGPHDRAVRTNAWLLRQPITGAAELYAKPSDRWEVNEVAKLLPEVVEGLAAALDELVRRGGVTSVPLAPLLTTEVD